MAAGARVVDVACGIGYGATILADAGGFVVGIDNDAEAIAYGRRHWSHSAVDLRKGDACRLDLPSGSFDAAVCFETIEHLADPRPMLRALNRAAPVLLASVPNEAVFPFKGYAYHHRHYRRSEFEALLTETGWRVTGWCGQAGPESSVERGVEGRTIVVMAERAEQASVASPSDGLTVPNHVVILGMGPSLEGYVDLAKRMGARRALADEVWGINAVADVVNCDRVFHMDDVRIQEIRAAARPQSNIAQMLPWLRRHPGPIYTSRTHPDYPGLVEFPLQDVINSCGFAYFNSTAAYAVAYAVHIGVRQISMFGFDFTYPNAHDAEKGRACVEFHLGIAKARGIEIGFPANTSLMDACAPLWQRVYGYDAVDVVMEQPDDGGPVSVSFTPKTDLPTADEIEARYDHSKHPNLLVKG